MLQIIRKGTKPLATIGNEGVTEDDFKIPVWAVYVTTCYKENSAQTRSYNEWAASSVYFRFCVGWILNVQGRIRRNSAIKILFQQRLSISTDLFIYLSIKQMVFTFEAPIIIILICFFLLKATLSITCCDHLVWDINILN